MQIVTRVDMMRGCGWRKPGNLYLVTRYRLHVCGKLPIRCDRCPTCGAGIKPSRGWAWVDGDELVKDAVCKTPQECAPCALNGLEPLGRVGLLWIGPKTYKTPDVFCAEAQQLGVSRAIPAIPNGFKLGETRVFLAHRHCNFEDYSLVEPGGPPRLVKAPGIFACIRPTAIEYVVKEHDDQEKLEKLAARGVTLVRVQRVAGGPAEDQEGAPEEQEAA